MKINSKNQFGAIGAIGVADAGALAPGHARPAALRHRMQTPFGVLGPAGDEQLR